MSIFMKTRRKQYGFPKNLHLDCGFSSNFVKTISVKTLEDFTKLCQKSMHFVGNVRKYLGLALKLFKILRLSKDIEKIPGLLFAIMWKHWSFLWKLGLSKIMSDHNSIKCFLQKGSHFHKSMISTLGFNENVRNTLRTVLKLPKD